MAVDEAQVKLKQLCMSATSNAQTEGGQFVAIGLLILMKDSSVAIGLALSQLGICAEEEFTRRTLIHHGIIWTLYG